MITVITVVKNREATIAATIESLLRQTYTDWQHVIIDGASTDGTLSVVRSYEEQYAGRLTLLSEHDAGLYDAMNKGLRLAKGDIVGFLNSDDRFTSDGVLAAVVNGLSDKAIDAVYGNVRYRTARRVVRHYNSARFHRAKMLCGWMPAHPSFYCRRELYERFGGYDLQFRIAADFECLLRMIYIGCIATRYLDLCFVDMRTGGVSGRGLRSHLTIAVDHMRAFRKHRLWSGLILDHLRYPAKLLGR